MNIGQGNSYICISNIAFTSLIFSILADLSYTKILLYSHSTSHMTIRTAVTGALRHSDFKTGASSKRAPLRLILHD